MQAIAYPPAHYSAGCTLFKLDIGVDKNKTGFYQQQKSVRWKKEETTVNQARK
jgi:hypothetical protein